MKKKVIIAIGIVVLLLVGAMVFMAMSFSNIKVTYLDKPNNESKVQTVKFGHSNIYFIATKRGHILVDAGVPGSEEKLDEVFTHLKIDPKSVHLIVATHGHMDHIGGLVHAKQLTGAEILCHQSILEKITNGKYEESVPQNSFGRFLNFMTGVLDFFGGSKIKGIKPDILIKAEYNLSEHGIEGRIIPIPGHSSGSISIVLEDGETLVGDLIRGEPSELTMGMFYEDENQVMESLKKIAAYNSKIIYLSHGGYISNTDLKKAIERLKI